MLSSNAMTATLPILVTPKTSKNNKRIFVLDFKSAPMNVRIPSGLWKDAPEIHYSTWYDATDAFVSLNRLHEDAQAPMAIIVHFDLLRQYGFQLVKRIRTNLLMQNVPLIAVGNQGQMMDISILRMGIDDIYTEPLDWQEVKNRIDFLHRFRVQLLAEADNWETLTLRPMRLPMGKRLFDIVAASAILTVASPFLLAIAAMIRLESKGPIIYRSRRAGMNYEVFDFLKFRSMYPDADQRLKELQHLNQYSDASDDPNAPKFVKFKNDPRVTRIGRVLRKFSVDEVPQLINILRGEMSFVGNRPLPLYEAQQLTKDEWAERFNAPAGLTGLWQVSKRGKSDMSVDERMQLDISYARNYNMAMDAQIFVRTFTAFVQSENV